MKKIFMIIGLGCNLLFQAHALANTDTQTEENYADFTHKYLSESILNLSEKVDQFFSDERSEDVVNNSQLKFYTLTRKGEGQDPSTSFDLRFNLVLPRTQKRLHLFVEGQGQDNPSDTDKTQQSSAGRSTSDQGQDSSQSQQITNATTAGLRYLTDVAGIKTSSDAGVRVNLPPQLFARLRLNKDIPINSDWVFRPREEVMWVDRQGFSSTTNLDFDRKISIDLLLRMVNKFYWSEEDDYAIGVTNGPSLFHKITDDIGFSYHAHIISNSDPEWAVNKYILSMAYRQALYKNWFFGEISPQLSFPREDSFRRTPSILFKLEIIMGDI